MKTQDCFFFFYWRDLYSVHWFTCWMLGSMFGVFFRLNMSGLCFSSILSTKSSCAPNSLEFWREGGGGKHVYCLMQISGNEGAVYIIWNPISSFLQGWIVIIYLQVVGRGGYFLQGRGVILSFRGEGGNYFLNGRDIISVSLVENKADC